MLAAPLMLALMPLAVHAGEPPEPARPKDAAEEVQEGNVDNWIKYYQRERGQGATPAPQPGPPAAPPSDPKPGGQR